MKQVATPMKRAQATMNLLRKEVSRLGFKKVCFNKAKGRSFKHNTTGRVESDYVEFYSVPNKALAAQESESMKYFLNFGFTFKFVDLPADEQTVKVSLQSRMSFEDLHLKCKTNATLAQTTTKELPLPVFLKFLNHLAQKAKSLTTQDEMLDEVRQAVKTLV